MHNIRSFLLVVSDQAGTLLDQFLVPVTGAALFINPLFQALPGADSTTLHEPWYQLVPRRLTTGPLNAPTLPAPSLPPPSGRPPITLIPDPHDPIRAMTVTLYDTQHMLYTADYSTVEVFGPILIHLLHHRIAAGHYPASAGPFRVRVDPQTSDGDPHLFALLPADLPVEGAFTLPTVQPNRPRATFQRLAPPDFATRSLAEFAPFTSVKPELPGQHHLLWHPAAFRALAETQPVSATVEVGGYLIGQVYQQAAAPTTLLIEVQQVLAAVHTQASATLLVFTNESWSILHRRLSSDLRDLRLVGWWHTHLFPATETFGLSGLDETLHRQFFTQPWQVAALLNVSAEQGRVLRCYLPDAQQVLQECPYRVLGTDRLPTPPPQEPAPVSTNPGGSND